MTTLGEASTRWVAVSLALGILGGAALISTVVLTSRGSMIFVPYAAIILAAAVYLRVQQVRAFLQRFVLVLGAFMTATLIVYVYIFAFSRMTTAPISLAGHAWRLGLVLAIGGVLSAAVAGLAAKRSV